MGLEPQIVWTTTARKKVLPTRATDGGPAGPAPTLDRAVLHARLAERYRSFRAQDGGSPACAADLEAAVRRAERLLRTDDPKVPLELDLEVVRAALVRLRAAEPHDETASALIGYWVAAGGAGFAVTALARSWRLQWSGPVLSLAPRLDWGEPDNLGGWTALRVYLSTAPYEAYEEARRTGEALRREANASHDRAGFLLRCALSYAFPNEAQWIVDDVDEAVVQPAVLQRSVRHGWCLLASARDLSQAERLIEMACAAATAYCPYRCADFAWSMLDLLGPEGARLLAALIEAPQPPDHRKIAADALSLVESPVAAACFARNLSTPGAAASALKYLQMHPALALAALCGVAPQSQADAPGQLLAGLVNKHPELLASVRQELDEGGRAALQRAMRWVERGQAAVLEDAPLAELPAPLREGGSRRKLPAFWDAQMLPRIALREGRAVPLAAMDRFGHLLAASTIEEPAPGLIAVREACTPESLAEFAWAVCGRWLQSDAPSKDKWALHSLAHIGGDNGARRLAGMIPEWPSARAAMGLEVLGAIGSEVALTYAKRIGDKTKSKAMRGRVEALIDSAAQARGLSRDELDDRMVPDLGLVDGGRRVLDYGPRQFRIGFDAHNAYAIDGQGTRLTRLPKPSKTDDPAKADAAQREWKALKADAELILGVQVKRFESAMCHRRRWKEQDFRFLCSHPLLGQLARRVVWEAGDAAGKAIGTFRVAEDGTLAGMNDQPFHSTGLRHAWIPHPLELSAECIEKWSAVLADYEIVEPFPQLTRPFYVIQDEERRSPTCARFKGMTTSTNRLQGIRHRGWKGGWEYGGEIFKKFEGTPYVVGLAVELPATLGLVTLHESMSVEETHRRPFGQLDAILFSEMIRDLEWLKATGA